MIAAANTPTKLRLIVLLLFPWGFTPGWAGRKDKRQSILLNLSVLRIDGKDSGLTDGAARRRTAFGRTTETRRACQQELGRKDRLAPYSAQSV
jgi:hypothetical protein